MWHDVLIIGGGPAGLSAGLILGRCQRRVAIFDSGRPRNAMSRGLHGYLTRDGIHPLRFRELGRAELAAYPSVTVHDQEIARVERIEDGFEIMTARGIMFSGRLLLLATGRVDSVPDRPGFAENYGRGIYHCPYCDGWEHRGQPLVAYGSGRGVWDLAFDLLTWSPEVTVCVDDAEDRTPVPDWAGAVRVMREPVKRYVPAGREGVGRLELADGSAVPCGALFFCSDCEQHSSIPSALGCRFSESGAVKCDGHAATNVPGLYVAGNVRGGLHLAITAAAEGVEAAVAINDALREAEVRTALERDRAKAR